MNIEIKHRLTGGIIISGEYKSVKDCVEKNRGANLRGADLWGADLCGADLWGADLCGANLCVADLCGAKGYVNSHEVFTEVVRTQKASLFLQSEWSAIGQIVIHRLCWDTIKKRFSKVMPSIFQKLADAGFGEWLEYWNTITEVE
jgi:hypothetical protein